MVFNNKFLFAFGILVLLIGFSSAQEIMMDSCGVLDQPGTNYILLNDVHSDGDCFEIRGEDITLNGDGFSVVGDGGKGDYGVYSLDSFNIEIANITIDNFQYSIYFDGVSNSSIVNSILTNGGLKIIASENLLIDNNHISNGGLMLTTLRKSIIANNFIHDNEMGIKILNSHYNTFRNNSVYNNENGLYLLKSSNNEFSNSFLNGNDYGVYLDASYKNVFRDLNVASNLKDVSLISSSHDNIFVNSNHSSEEVESGSKLIRKWYLDLNVADSVHFLDNARVSLFSVDGYLQFSSYTNETGDLERQEVIEYVNNGRRNIDYNDYKIEIVKDGQSTSRDLVLRENKFVQINFDFIGVYPDFFPISNLSVNPLLPLTNNGSAETITIDFDSELYPLNVSVLLFKQFTEENESFSVIIYNQEIKNGSYLPLNLVIPENLANGTYALNLTVWDSTGNRTTVSLGFIEVQNINSESDDSNPDTGSDNSDGGGSGGSGSNSGSGGGSSIRRLNSTVNDTLVLSPVNSTPVNNTLNDEENKTGRIGITGAVIGALEGNGKWIGLIILILLVVLGYMILSAKEDDEKKVTENKTAKSDEGKKKNGEKK